MTRGCDSLPAHPISASAAIISPYLSYITNPEQKARNTSYVLSTACLCNQRQKIEQCFVFFSVNFLSELAE